MQFSQKRKYQKGMEHTAMTDIVFLLLIFFLLTSSFVVHSGVKVNLPQTTNLQPLVKQDIIVTITPGLDILFVNENKITRGKLFESLVRELKGNQEKLVIFQADKKVLVGTLVEAMDTAKRAGAKQVAIASKQENE